MSSKIQIGKISTRQVNNYILILIILFVMNKLNIPDTVLTFFLLDYSKIKISQIDSNNGK